METIEFFSEVQRMRGYRGDTFPPFYLRVDGMDTDSCEMRLVLEKQNTPGGASFIKDCDHFRFRDGGKGFRVQLSSGDTTLLCGVYTAHFILKDEDDLEYRKLVGTLEVLPVPQEVV